MSQKAKTSLLVVVDFTKASDNLHEIVSHCFGSLVYSHLFTPHSIGLSFLLLFIALLIVPSLPGAGLLLVIRMLIMPPLITCTTPPIILLLFLNSFILFSPGVLKKLFLLLDEDLSLALFLVLSSHPFLFLLDFLAIRACIVLNPVLLLESVFA